MRGLRCFTQRIPSSQAIDPLWSLHVSGRPNVFVQAQPPMQAHVGVPWHLSGMGAQDSPPPPATPPISKTHTVPAGQPVAGQTPLKALPSMEAPPSGYEHVRVASSPASPLGAVVQAPPIQSSPTQHSRAVHDWAAIRQLPASPCPPLPSVPPPPPVPASRTPAPLWPPPPCAPAPPSLGVFVRPQPMMTTAAANTRTEPRATDVIMVRPCCQG